MGWEGFTTIQEKPFVGVDATTKEQLEFALNRQRNLLGEIENLKEEIEVLKQFNDDWSDRFREVMDERNRLKFKLEKREGMHKVCIEQAHKVMTSFDQVLDLVHGNEPCKLYHGPHVQCAGGPFAPSGKDPIKIKTF